MKTLAVFLPSSTTALEAQLNTSVQRFELNQHLLRCRNSNLKEYPKSSAHIWLFVIYLPSIETIFNSLGSRHHKIAGVSTVTNKSPNVNPLRKFK